MNVVFRVNASSDIGFGHFKRCCSLAKIIPGNGNLKILLTNKNNPFLLDSYSVFDKVFVLQDEKVASRQDSEFLLSITKHFISDWIVLDGYEFNQEFERSIFQGKLAKIFRIDDFPRYEYFADVILSQNVGAEEWVFETKNPNGIKALGLDYCLLPPELLLESQVKLTESLKTSVLLTLGGTSKNSYDVLVAILDALKKQDVSFYDFTILVPSDQIRSRLTHECYENLPIKVLGIQKDMIELYKKSDLVITAPGITMWEVAYLGIPLIVIPLNKSQIDFANHLEKVGFSSMIDPSLESFKSSFLDLLYKYGKNKPMYLSKKENLKGIFDKKKIAKNLKNLFNG